MSSLKEWTAVNGAHALGVAGCKQKECQP
jgi:hypothetical protein